MIEEKDSATIKIPANAHIEGNKGDDNKVNLILGILYV